MALVAAVFCLISNPRVLKPASAPFDFEPFLTRAVVLTVIVALVTLPWLRIPVVPWPWILFLGLCTLSVTWSIAPAATIGTVIFYAKITVIALIIGANVDLRVLAWGLGLGGVVIVGLSLYVVHRDMPGSSYTILSGKRIFSGVGGNRNILAYTIILSLAAILSAPWPRRMLSRALWISIVLIDVYGLLRAESGTGFVAAAMLLITLPFLWLVPRIGKTGRHILLALAGAALALMTAVVVVVVHVLHKDLTLSGRVPLWTATIETTRANWLHGWGWGAVWAHGWHPAHKNSVTKSIFADAGFVQFHGHNYFIDLLPEVGVLGILAAALLVAYPLRIAYLARSGTLAPGLTRFVALMVVALLTVGLTEPMLTIPLGWWVLTTVAAFAAMARVQAGEPLRSSKRNSRGSGSWSLGGVPLSGNSGVGSR